MDHEAKKKYCGLLMFDMASPVDGPATPTSPKVNNSVLRKETDRPHSFMGAPYPKSSKNASLRHSIKKPSATPMEPKEPRISRPPNAFILYRHSIQPSIIAQHRNITNAEISKQLSVMWRNEPESVKLQWQKEADRRKMEHMAAHPDYVYRPKKPSGQKTPKKPRAVRGVQAPKITSPPPSETTSETASAKIDNSVEFPLLASLGMLSSAPAPSSTSVQQSHSQPSQPSQPTTTEYWYPPPSATLPDTADTYGVQLHLLDQLRDAYLVPSDLDFEQFDSKVFPDLEDKAFSGQGYNANATGGSCVGTLEHLFPSELGSFSYSAMLASDDLSFDFLS